MKFLANSQLLSDRELKFNINSAANRIFDKLNYLKIRKLDISNYNKRYFGNKMRNLQKVLQLYSYILAISLKKSKIPLSDFIFLDYGGGSGMLSLLAKELGVGTVIYNDIYNVSCHDAEIIAGLIGNKADYYVHGDIDDVLGFLKINNLDCNAVGSYDVIEHIYDIKYYFRKIVLLSKSSLKICLSSGANTFNPLIRRKIIKKQLEAEYFDREKIWGHKERDDLKSYLKIRKEMICDYLQVLNKQLSEKKISQLAANTRGLIRADIKKYVDEYLKKETYPPVLDHPTNTCDPYTGNWAESLMNPFYLATILKTLGFQVKILNGFYGNSKNAAKTILGKILNIIINISKKQGIRFAPFFTLYAERD